jgi:chromosome segregation ATPase
VSLSRDETLRELVTWLSNALRYGLEVCEDYRDRIVALRMEMGSTTRRLQTTVAELTEYKAKFQRELRVAEELRAELKAVRAAENEANRLQKLEYAKLNARGLQQSLEAAKEGRRVAQSLVKELRRQIKDRDVSIEQLRAQLQEARRGPK